MINTLVLTLHVSVALALIVIVLFQHGKGASMGSAFGGSSQTLFGSRGPATAMAKITTVAAIIFMLTSISLSVMSPDISEESVVSDTETPAALPVTLPEKDTALEPGPIAPTENTEWDIAENSPSSPIGPVETDRSGGNSNK